MRGILRSILFTSQLGAHLSSEAAFCSFHTKLYGHTASRRELHLALNSCLALNNHTFNTFRILSGIFECRPVNNALRIEDRKVCLCASLNAPIPAKLKSLRSQARHLAHGLFQRQQVLLAHVA